MATRSYKDWIREKTAKTALFGAIVGASIFGTTYFAEPAAKASSFALRKILTKEEREEFLKVAQGLKDRAKSTTYNPTKDFLSDMERLAKECKSPLVVELFKAVSTWLDTWYVSPDKAATGIQNLATILTEQGGPAAEMVR